MTIQSCLKVAVAQTHGALGNLQHNLQEHLRLLDQAHVLKVDLLLFPELSLTGYQLGDRALDVALHRDDPILIDLARAARGMHVVAGFVEEGPGAALYNASAILRDGAVVSIHRKLNVPTYGKLEEGKLYTQGRTVGTCPIRGPWDAATLICADLWNPALVHLAVLRGATLILAPINSALGAVGGGFSNPEGWDLALRFYAMMYGTPILMANRLGPEGEARFWGGSRILSPLGNTLAAVSADETGLACAELDYAQLRQARFHLPTIRDSNPDRMIREMQRILDDQDCRLHAKDPS